MFKNEGGRGGQRPFEQCSKKQTIWYGRASLNPTTRETTKILYIQRSLTFSTDFKQWTVIFWAVNRVVKKQEKSQKTECTLILNGAHSGFAKQWKFPKWFLLPAAGKEHRRHLLPPPDLTWHVFTYLTSPSFCCVRILAEKKKKAMTRSLFFVHLWSAHLLKCLLWQSFEREKEAEGTFV